MEKGIAFPVCVSVNEYVCHYSPLHNEDTVIECKCIDSIKIKNRIDSLFVYHIIFKLYIFWVWHTLSLWCGSLWSLLSLFWAWSDRWTTLMTDLHPIGTPIQHHVPWSIDDFIVVSVPRWLDLHCSHIVSRSSVLMVYDFSLDQFISNIYFIDICICICFISNILFAFVINLIRFRLMYCMSSCHLLLKVIW